MNPFLVRNILVVLLLLFLIVGLVGVVTSIGGWRRGGAMLRGALAGCTLLVLVFLLLYFAFPLDLMRLTTGNPAIPTTEEVRKRFADVQRALEDTSGNRYRSDEKANIDLTVTLELPQECGLRRAELDAMSHQAASTEVSRLIRLLASTDADLLKHYQSLTPPERPRAVRLSISQTVGEQGNPLCIDLRRCALGRLANFGSFGQEAWPVVLRQLLHGPSVSDVDAVKEAMAVSLFSLPAQNQLTASVLDVIFELLYSPDITVRNYASRLLLDSSAALVPALANRLDSLNPDVTVAALEAMAKHPDSASNFKQQIAGLTESPFPSVAHSAVKTYLIAAGRDQAAEELILRALSSQNNQALPGILQALKESPVLSSEIAAKVYAHFNVRQPADLQLLIIGALGSIGPKAATQLVKLAKEISCEGDAVRPWHRDCQSTTEEVVCGDVFKSSLAEKDQYRRQRYCFRPCSLCDDPLTAVNFGQELLTELPKGGNNLISLMSNDPCNSGRHPAYVALLYRTAIQTAEADPQVGIALLQRKMLSGNLFNRLDLIRLAGLVDAQEARAMLREVLKGPDFGRCVSNNERFASYYRKLGQKVLDE